MLVFWMIAVLFILIALGLILPPLLRNKADKTAKREEINISVYQDQLEELENDLANGTISNEQYVGAKVDIEKNLLDDVDSDINSTDDVAKSEVQNSIASSKMGKAVAVAMVILLPAISIGLYGKWGAGEAGLDPQNAVAEVNTDQHELSLDDMLAQLEGRLQANPNDGEGWYMLARTYQFMQRYDDAVSAFERSIKLGGGQSADVLSSYADVRAMANGRITDDRTIEILEQALQIDPKHTKSLWLAGTAAYQMQEYKSALAYWERLYEALPEGGEDRAQIAVNINEVKSLMGTPIMLQSAPVDEQEEELVATTARITGSVGLANEISAKASPEDTVFVFARAVQGSRMPLAIVRKQVKDLPFEFVLDDSQAMSPQMKLSSHTNVIVGARVSKSGDAIPQAGDLEGFSGELILSSNVPVALVIDTVIN